ncbi:MAG: hypothetical protein V4604_13715 [Bacteroidota bacterium]
MSSEEKLAICIIGYPNSGKSKTWYSLFGQTVKRGKYERELQIFEDEENSIASYVDVFLINGSPQESGCPIDDMIPLPLPKIILCSLQYAEGPEYVEDLFGSIRWFEDNGYKIFAIWLNPGWADPYTYFDEIGLINRIHKQEGNLLTRRDANKESDIRAQEIREFLFGWAEKRKLTY